MNRKLTAQQVKELVTYHRKAGPKQGPAKPSSMRILDPDEAAKLLPGIVTHHTVTVNRPPAERSNQP